MLPTLKIRNSWPSLFDEFFKDNYLPESYYRENGKNMPAVNIAESNDEYTIEVAAPGLSKGDFKVNLENNVLTISSEKETKNETEDRNVLCREFSYSSFSRSFTLPDSVNGDKIRATHNDGILSIAIPKKEEAKVKPAKEIKIS